MPGETVRILVRPKIDAPPCLIALVARGLLLMDRVPPYEFEFQIPRDQYPEPVELTAVEMPPHADKKVGLLHGSMTLVVKSDQARPPLRDPNPYELLFFNGAIDNYDVALCDKIAPNVSYSSADDPSLLKSWCYQEVAGQTGQAELCDKVRSISFFQFEGRSTSQSACVEWVKRMTERRRHRFPNGKTGYSTGVSIDFGVLRKFMLEIGYTEDDIHRHTAADEKNAAYPIYQLYSAERDKPEFMSKIKGLKSFTE